MSTKVLVGAAIAVALCSCATAEPTAPAASTPVSTTAVVLDIPSVDAPLDPGPLDTDPCAVLGESKRAALGLPSATTKREVGGPACHLAADGAGPADYLRIKLNYGLTRVAGQCGSSPGVRCDGWSVETIAGYPAILANGDLEARYGSCKLLLGISDTTSVLLVDARSTPAAGPDCVRATEVAALVVAALRQP